MTERQARRIERLLRFQCYQNHNMMVALRVLVAEKGGADPAEELEGSKRLLMELLDALGSDEKAEHQKVAQTREQEEALDAELQRLDNELAHRPPIGFK